MKTVTLVLWILTACAGLYLLSVWLRNGGLRQTKVTRFPKVLIFTHPALAVAGLALWVAFLAGGGRAYAWAAFAALVVTAMLGFTMLTRWLMGGGRHARGAEQHFPVVAVVLHGLTGVSTFVLTLLTATTLA
ncbi:hypothetical protein [Bailinhaonella thermotolerans]|uniref:Uncharacterized protein n=1 Tax=Bailinhaonella thermotolerans TaxID=1070861 RepID=A0A3A4AWC2_9ACTN|nr:hypothetical protein [Bailinhaonella thermotolerans]RJL34195.1 hypothetical protein D5H75_06910 [Bailinhaonella thermotolerans]